MQPPAIQDSFAQYEAQTHQPEINRLILSQLSYPSFHSCWHSPSEFALKGSDNGIANDVQHIKADLSYSRCTKCHASCVRHILRIKLYTILKPKNSALIRWWISL